VRTLVTGEKAPTGTFRKMPLSDRATVQIEITIKVATIFIIVYNPLSQRRQNYLFVRRYILFFVIRQNSVADGLNLDGRFKSQFLLTTGYSSYCTLPCNEPALAIKKALTAKTEKKEFQSA